MASFSYIIHLPIKLGKTTLTLGLYQGARMKARKEVPIENYRRLVAQQAWKAWRCLPFSTRTWIGIDDMIEDGMWSVHWFLNKSKCYDPSRSHKYTTILTHILHNMYIRKYIEKYGSQKSGWSRVDGKLVPIYVDSLEAMRDRMKEGRAGIDDVVGQIPSLSVTEESIVQSMLTECFVVPALSRVYKQASISLQEEIVNWFWFKSKVHTKGKPFRRLSGEFRELCKEEMVRYDDCMHLIRSPKCLDSLSRELLWIPYDINNPTPDMKPVKLHFN